MANWNILQESFAQGVLSPRLSGQVQQDAVRNGLSEAENAVCFPQGPVAKRPGTQLMGVFDPPVENANWRVWQFIGPDNNDLVAAFYEGEVSVIDPATGVINSADVPYQVVNHPTVFTFPANGWYRSLFTFENVEYRVNNSGLAAGTSYVLQKITNNVTQSFPPLYYFQRPYFFYQIPTNLGYGEFLLQVRLEAIGDGPNGELISTPGVHIRARVAIETSLEGGEIAEEIIDLSANVERLVQISGTIPPGPTPAQILANITLIIETDSGFGWGAGRYVSMRIYSAYIYARQLVPPTPVVLATPYLDSEIPDLHFVQSPLDNRELIILHPNHEPQALYFDTVGAVWECESYPFIAPAPEWSSNNYPSIGAAVQGRLFLGGVPSVPEKFWASETYDWYNIYSASPPSSKTDPLEFIAQERDINTWIISGKNVLYGDRRAERELYSVGEVLAGDDVGVRTQTYYGSERMPQKIMVGKYVVISTGGRTDLRLMFYSRQDFGYISPNIVLKAEQFGQRKFKRHFFTRKPHPILWNVMDDGSLVICSFDDEMQVSAWSSITIAQGFVIDGCSTMNADGIDAVLLAVRRIVGGEEKICHELLSQLDAPSNWLTTDATIRVFDNSGMTGFLSGFADLENLEVAVFLDGDYDGRQVVTDGQVFVSRVSQEVTVGIPFTFDIATMPQASIAVQSGLTSQKRYSKVGIRGIFGLPPLINGQRPADRSPASTMDIPEPAVSLYDSDVVDMETTPAGIIRITEDEPVQITVTAIYGKLSSNQL